MRLDVALVNGLGPEAALHDHVGLGEGGVGVAQHMLQLAGDVRRGAVEHHEVMQNRRAGLHRLLDVDHPGQNLVVDFDQLDRFRGDRLAGRRDRRDRMAREQGLLARHDVAGHPAHVLDAQHH